MKNRMRVRIVDKVGYFHIQTWRWWFPFWYFEGLTADIDHARKIAKALKHPNIEEIL
jgi:hypothetical protein